MLIKLLKSILFSIKIRTFTKLINSQCVSFYYCKNGTKKCIVVAHFYLDSSMSCGYEIFEIFHNIFGILKQIHTYSIPDAVDNEILALSERLFDASTPNIFNQITVNLQGRTFSSKTTDEAPGP